MCPAPMPASPSSRTSACPPHPEHPGHAFVPSSRGTLPCALQSLACCPHVACPAHPDSHGRRGEPGHAAGRREHDAEPAGHADVLVHAVSAQGQEGVMSGRVCSMSCMFACGLCAREHARAGIQIGRWVPWSSTGTCAQDRCGLNAMPPMPDHQRPCRA